MKKTLALILCMSAIAFAPMASIAASKSDAMAALKTAREKLVTLIDTKEKGAQDALIGEIHKASNEVDSQLTALSNDPKVKEVASIWAEFKKTRETEIIPAVKKGDVAKAKEIATGIQKERFKKMMDLLQ